MSKPSAGALRAALAVRDIYGDPDHPHAWDHEYAAKVIDKETSLPAFLEVLQRCANLLALHERTEAHIKAEGREGT